MSETFTTQTYITRVTILGCGITVIACCGVELVAHCTEMARLLTFTGSMALSWGITEWIASQNGKGLLSLLERDDGSDEHDWHEEDNQSTRVLVNMKKESSMEEDQALLQNYKGRRKRSRSDEGKSRNHSSVQEMGKRTRTPTKARSKLG